jgi:hypothetical protein
VVKLGSLQLLVVAQQLHNLPRIPAVRRRRAR